MTLTDRTRPTGPVAGSPSTPDGPASSSDRRRARAGAYHVVMTVLVVLYILPVLWAVSMSLRTDAHMFEANQLIPHPITFDHYANLFDILPDFGRYVGNTLLIAVLGTAGTLLSSSLAGYALARFSFPGSRALLMVILLTLMVPPQVTLIPQYVIFRNLGWINSPLPIIVPMLFGGALPTFFFRQFFLTLPLELEDAAAIDGAGRWRTFFRVIAPLAGPAYLAMGLLTFVQLWNSFFVNSIYLQDQNQWVLTQALQSLVGRYNSQYGEIMAGVTLVSLPVLVGYLFIQRWVVRGIAFSGMAN
ncbi:carbohydrate ABC transporter permease [Streptomyces sp. NBC_01477]|uniref:carbohydrate ABC transporter permease n=1 Tax=Streptomyces sp. NBC_01477 TaxID=2976015 RepID=UPI002E31A92A|nr:carbohydrate ABC transporter permease [Streptomyces sp. NBC_01477]